jgi:hypothetical protein
VIVSHVLRNPPRVHSEPRVISYDTGIRPTPGSHHARSLRTAMTTYMLRGMLRILWVLLPPTPRKVPFRKAAQKRNTNSALRQYRVVTNTTRIRTLILNTTRWPRGTVLSQIPSAVTSTLNHPFGSSLKTIPILIEY